MLKRSPIVIAGTIAGTAGVLAFHTHSPAVQTASASTSTAVAAATATATPSAAGTSTSGGSSTSSGSSGGGVSGTATGDAVDTRYGPAQVKVTVKDGKITSIEAVTLQDGDPRSSQISASAAPVLQQEVLSKQTTAVDAVSGATYTSASYLQSAQAALDQLGFQAADGSQTTLQVPA